MTATTESFELVSSVEPEISRLMAEHRERRQHWYAHDVVPWELGRSFRRSEEHTSELQSLVNLVCRLLLEKNKK